jgi:hypothetical protein
MFRDVILVPASRVEAVKARVAKLQKRAKKYGNGDIILHFGEAETHKITGPSGDKIAMVFYPLIVVGRAPLYQDGWKLMGRIEPIGENGNCLIHTIPGHEIDARFREHGTFCEHCQINRYRKDLYVFEKDGKQIAVGRTCLRDFTGCDDPKTVAQRVAMFMDLREEIGNEEDWAMGFGSNSFRTETVLSKAAAHIRKNGFVSKKVALDQGISTTADDVKADMRGYPEYRVDTDEKDAEIARMTMEKFRQDEKFDNDFMENARLIILGDYIDLDHFGIAVAAVSVAIREKAKLENTAKAAAQSAFVGSVKERLRGLKLRVERVVYLGCGAYGDRYLLSMKDDNGNVMVWFTGAATADEGDDVVLDGTVKEHKVYNGISQTVLTNCRVK